jgi:hypothetical protein
MLWTTLHAEHPPQQIYITEQFAINSAKSWVTFCWQLGQKGGERHPIQAQP